MNPARGRPATYRGGLSAFASVAVPLAALVFLVAACGSAIPTLAPATPAAVSPTPAAAEASPSPGATGALEAPTPEPARTARIPEVRCPTTFGMPDETPGPIPTTMTATLTPAVAALVTFYGNGTLTLLGPKDWQCVAVVGVDGSASMTITPPGQPAPPASPPGSAARSPAAGSPAAGSPAAGSSAAGEQAVTAYTGGACVGCIATMACGLFPEAWNLFATPGSSCPTVLPARERVTRPGPRSAVFEDPPGVAGTGEPSGGRYRAIGLLVYDPGTGAGGNGLDVPSALKVTCTLPDTMSQICDELIEGAGQGESSTGG